MEVKMQTILDQMLGQLYCGTTQDSFPKYNYYAVEGNHYLEIGLAGYKQTDLDLEVVEKQGIQQLVLRGKADRPKLGKSYINTLPFRAFKLTWQLGDLTLVGATYVDGLLTIHLTEKTTQSQKIPID
jgi:HSP20 family molecular chaperone IbpA